MRSVLETVMIGLRFADLSLPALLIFAFASQFMSAAGDYPKRAFELYDARTIEKLVDSNQPDILAARAAAADKSLNNQSLVVLFSFKGKNCCLPAMRSGETGRTSSMVVLMELLDMPN